MFKSIIQWIGSVVAAVMLLSIFFYLLVTYPVLLCWLLVIFSVFMVAYVIKSTIFKD